MGDLVDVMPSPTSISPTSNTGEEEPMRKQQKRSNNGNSNGNGNGNGAMGATSTSSASQSGPPYICPTCQTSYSRLEYLRRHERRRKLFNPDLYGPPVWKLTFFSFLFFFSLSSRRRHPTFCLRVWKGILTKVSRRCRRTAKNLFGSLTVFC